MAQWLRSALCLSLGATRLIGYIQGSRLPLHDEAFAAGLFRCCCAVNGRVGMMLDDRSSGRWMALVFFTTIYRDPSAGKIPGNPSISRNPSRTFSGLSQVVALREKNK